MLKSLFDPEKAYQETLARAERNGLTYDQQADLDKYMARVYEAQIHLGDLGFVALAVLYPAFAALAPQAALLSAWVIGTRTLHEGAVDDFANAQTRLDLELKAAKAFVIWLVMAAGGFGMLGLMLTTALAVIGEA